MEACELEKTTTCLYCGVDIEPTDRFGNINTEEIVRGINHYWHKGCIKALARDFGAEFIQAHNLVDDYFFFRDIHNEKFNADEISVLLANADEVEAYIMEEPENFAEWLEVTKNEI